MVPIPMYIRPSRRRLSNPWCPYWLIGNQARRNSAARRVVPVAARAPGPGCGSVASASSGSPQHEQVTWGVTSYENEVVQTIDIRWGRIVAITTLEDTQKLVGALERLAAQGVEEAGAAPIEDRVAASSGSDLASEQQDPDSRGVARMQDLTP